MRINELSPEDIEAGEIKNITLTIIITIVIYWHIILYMVIYNYPKKPRASYMEITWGFYFKTAKEVHRYGKIIWTIF